MSFLGMTAAQAAALAAVTAGSIVLLYVVKLRRRRALMSSLLLWQKILEEHQARSIFERLRYPLSLLLALAIGLLLAMALARPEIEALTGKRRRVTLVLDTSPTMLTKLARTGETGTRWDRAVEKALALVDDAGPAVEFRVADTSGFVDAPYTADHSAVRQRIAAMRPRLHALRFPDTDDAANAEAWFVTDGVAKIEVPAAVQRMGVFESAPNAGIVAFEIRPEPFDPLHYSAYLDVRNYGKTAVEARIALTGAEGRRIDRTVKLDPSGRFEEAFDLSSFPGGTVLASVDSPGDAFGLDDRAFAYIPVQRKMRAVLVSKGAPHLEAALRLNPHVDLRIASPETFAEEADADVYVFNRFAPQTPPSKPSLVIGAPAAPWLPVASGAVKQPAVSTIAESHPLLSHVSLHDVSMTQAAKIDGEKIATEGWTVVVASRETPLIAASGGSGPKRVLLTFGVDESDFRYQAGFPVFIGNAVGWLAQESLPLQRTPGLVRLPFPDASVVETSDEVGGRRIESRTLVNETVFETEVPGLYVAAHDGVQQRVAVNLASREFSNINDSSVATVLKAPPRPLLSRELWSYLLVAALVLLVVEWITYHRRVTL